MLDPELIIEDFINPYEKNITDLFTRDTIDIMQASIKNLKQDIAQGA